MKCRHLLNVGEILGLRMLSVHNSHFYLKVMSDLRAHLAAGTFADFRREFAARYVPTERVLAGRRQAEAAAELPAPVEGGPATPLVEPDSEPV